MINVLAIIPKIRIIRFTIKTSKNAFGSNPFLYWSAFLFQGEKNSFNKVLMEKKLNRKLKKFDHIWLVEIIDLV
jgi:hypothetical protein